VNGRTIHSDGKIIPFEGKPFEKTILKGKTIKYVAKTFTLPDVQPGSILEFQYTLIYPDGMIYPPRFLVQDPLWQSQAHFRFYMYPNDVVLDHDQIANGIAWTVRLPKDMQVKQVETPDHKVYVDLNVTNVPPFVEEPYMPDSDQFKYHVRFYYKISNKPEEYWKNEIKFWNKDVEKFVGKQDGIKEALANIVGPSDSPEQKARKIYAFVVGLDNEGFLPSRTEQEVKTLNIKSITGASDVLQQKRGSPEDLNRLFIAMARSAGLNAYAMRVTSRENSFFDPAYLDFDQLDDEISIVQLNGQDVFLDPGAKFAAFGLLDWRHTITKGYRQTADKPLLADTPEATYKDAMMQRIARFTVKPDLSVEGPMRVIFHGFNATIHRQQAVKTDDEGRKKDLEDEVKSWLPVDADVKMVSTPNWNDVEAPLTADFKVSVNLASNAGKRILFPAQAFHFGQKPMFPHATRVNGIYFYYPSREIDDLTYNVTSGFAVETIPEKDVIQLPYALYTSSYEEKGRTIEIKRDLAWNALVFTKDEYPGVKGFYDKVKTNDEQQIILRSTGNAASGN
jgi:transglutaminase-like putative cysteine protease